MVSLELLSGQQRQTGDRGTIQTSQIFAFPHMKQVIMSIRSGASVCIRDMEASSSERSQTVLLLFVNLSSLILFGTLAFRLSAANLLYGLDGSYMMTIAKQQYVWTVPGFGLTNNFFQSLGNIWFPINTSFIPGYMLSLYLNGGEINPVVSYVIFSVELFLSAYLLCLLLRLGTVVATMASWGLVLAVMPYFGMAKVYPVINLVPHIATAIAATVAFLILFRHVGQASWAASAASVTGMVFLLLFITASLPVTVMLVAPTLAIFAICFIWAAESKREVRIKLVGGAMVIGASIALSLPQYFLGLFEYTAVHFFQQEFFNDRQSWYFASIVFHHDYGPLLFLLGLGGGLVTALGGRGLARATAIGLLVAMLLVVVFGAITVFISFWHGPSPLYFEFLLWPFYAVYAAIFICFLWGRGEAVVGYLVKRWTERWATFSSGVPGHVFCLGLLCLPWTILFFSYDVPAHKERDYPYPPRLTPIVKMLRDEVGLSPGDQFRGRVATFTGLSLQRPVNWLDLHRLDTIDLIRKFGDDHRTVGLWYYSIPTLFEYSPLISPPFYLMTRTFLSKTGDRQMRNVMTLRKIDTRILRAMGVRFLVTDVVVAEDDARFVLGMDSRGESRLYLYELDLVNLGNYTPTEVIKVADASEALVELSRPEFDPARRVVVDTLLPTALVPASSSKLFVEAGSLRLSAKSSGTSILLLPLEYSHCLDLKSVDSAVLEAKMFRANLMQAGIVFSGSLETTVKYFTGPFHNSGCRIEDVRDIDRLNFKMEVALLTSPSALFSSLKSLAIV